MANTQGIRAGRAFVELGVSDKLTAGLKRAQQRLQAFGAGVRSIGTNLIKVSAAVATPLVIGTTVFASFEQQMARVRALTGATGRDFQRLSDEAKRLGETTVFSASQAAEAMSFFALAGFDVGQILKAIGPTLNLAAAGQLEIAQAADIAAKIMAGMGIEADNLGNAVDVLTKAMTTANTDLQMLGDAMKYIGPIAKSAGIEFEEIVAAIQLLSNAGIQGEMAGTSLRGALLALTSPSEQARQVLDELGVRVLDAQGNVRSLADIIADLNAAMAGLGSGKKLEILGNIFQARQAAGVAELLSQGAPKLREFTEALRESGGVAGRIAGVQLNTLRGTITILKSTLEGLGIAVGEALVAPLRVVAHITSQVVTAISKWVRENRTLVVLVGVAALGIGAMGVGLFALGVASQVAAFAIGGLLKIMVGVKATFGVAALAIKAMLSPIGLVIAAVGALAAVILVRSGVAGEALAWLRDQFGRLHSFVSKVVTGMADALAAGDVALAARILWLALKQAWQEGVAALNRTWLQVKRFMLTQAQQMWTGLLSGAEFVWHSLKTGWIEATAFISRTWKQFTGFMELTWSTIKNVATKTLNHIKGLFDETFDVDAANLAADQALVAAEQRIEQEKNAKLAQLQKERQQNREAEQQRHESRLRDIIDAEDEALAELDQATDSQLEQTRQQLEEARRELAAALAEAKQKREKIEAEDQTPEGGKRGLLDGLAERLEGLGDVIADKITVTGTFNPVAVQGLAAAGDADERTAQATEQTAKHTKRLVDAATTGGLTFT
jgi:TP901 family phage tail tape measure protein